MSLTLQLPFARFIRQSNTAVAANTVWRATLAQAVEELATANWRRAADGVVVEMPISDPTRSFVSDAYDTFKSSGDAAANSGKQAAYVGMAAYRFTLPADALAGTPANVVSVALTAYADKFNWKGLLIAAYLSNSSTPPTDWAVLQAGDVATAIDETGRGILYEDVPATALSTNKTGDVTLTYAVAAAPLQYLYVIVQHAGWLECKYEYWIEGAGMLDGRSVAVTFDRDVTADAAASNTIPLVTGGIIYAPAAAPAMPSADTFREVVTRRETFGYFATYEAARLSSAMQAATMMFARLAQAGANAVNVFTLPFESWSPSQCGMFCALTRRVVGDAAPFSQTLDYAAAALAVLVSIPENFKPRFLKLVNSASSPRLPLSGATVNLAVYWIASVELRIEQAGQFAAAAQACFGDKTVSISGVTGQRVGIVDLPDAPVNGDALSVDLSGVTGRFGTLVLVPYIARVTAAALEIGSPVGLPGLTVGDESITGSGWVPDLTLEQ
jgi:hypothetical protein